MQQDAILSPLVTLVALTFVVLLQVPFRRFRAVFAGRVARDEFKYGESSLVASIILAWIYVGLRATHSLVHLSYNRVVHRLSLFASSNAVLAALWMRWFIAGQA